MRFRCAARTAVVAALAAAVATVTPWASAVENRLPSRPALGALATAGATCAGPDAAVVHGRPVLRARLDDADGDALTAQFEVGWSDDDGTSVRQRGSVTAPSGGDVFSWAVPDSVPDTSVVRWRVRARDGAGYGPWSDSAGQGTCAYRTVRETQPVAAWRLDDRNGSYSAAAWAGPFRGLSGPGVRFGDQGPDGRIPGSAYLDGGPYSYVNTDAVAVDTTHAFTAGAWVRPEEARPDMIAIGQSGVADVSNFTLGTVTGPDGKPAWGFALPSADGRTLVTGGTPRAGEWAHLAGSYDPGTGTARLYVDGALVATEDAAVPPDTGLWNFVMGRDGYDFSQKWQGFLSDVRLWDDAVPSEEIAELGRQKPWSFAHWQMESAETWEGGDQVIPEMNHHADFILHGDAHVGADAIEGSGSVVLDGDGDYLSSDIPPVFTDRSWAVSAKVRLAGVPDRDMALLAQTGQHNDAFTLRYRAADRAWEAVLAHADEADAATTRLDAPASGGTQTLELQYDAKAGEVQLYADGVLADTAPYAAADAWEAGGFLQAGRDSAADGAGAHFLDGTVDEVRTWSGVLSAEEVSHL